MRITEYKLTRDKLIKYDSDTWYSNGLKAVMARQSKPLDINPTTAITRYEIAKTLYEILNGKIPQTKILPVFQDIRTDDIISFATTSGLLVGDSNNNFNPNKQITRAEFMSILARLDNILN